jgi:polyisoprenyl-phosphate glycosyltransferase
MNRTAKVLSIVVPVYFNEENLPETIPCLLALGQHLPGYQLELVFVDDGSGDRSLEILLDFQKQYPNVIQVIKLTRNFGAVAALQAGLLHAHGDCVGVLAADLQDPPELFLDMIRYWETGTKAIFAVRQDREEGVFQKAYAAIYYRLVRRFALRNYPEGGSDCILIDRQVVNDVNRIQEKNSNVSPLVFWLGYRPVLLPYVRRARKKGRSRWTLGKKVKLFVDTFVSFSYFPIRALSVTGLLLSFGAFAYACVAIYGWLRNGVAVQGWLSMTLILLITSGIQMTMLGILGEYLWRTLEETRKRPPFVVDAVFPATAFDPKYPTNSHAHLGADGSGDK